MHSGDGYTTMRMYLMPLNFTLKMAKMVNLMLCIFYHNLKITHTHKETGNDGCLQRDRYLGTGWQDLLPLNLLYHLFHSVLHI